MFLFIFFHDYNLGPGAHGLLCAFISSSLFFFFFLGGGGGKGGWSFIVPVYFVQDCRLAGIAGKCGSFPETSAAG